MANEKQMTQLAPSARPEKIRCRVTGVNYGQFYRGDEIDVTERELLRVGPAVLVSLADEAKRTADQVRPPQDRKAIESENARKAAWKEMEAKREEMDRNWRQGQAQRIVDNGGAPPR